MEFEIFKSSYTNQDPSTYIGDFILAIKDDEGMTYIELTNDDLYKLEETLDKFHNS